MQLVRPIYSEKIATDETEDLIAATRVEGAAVYNSRGDSLGSIYDVMIDKRTGKVAYVIMAFGGFLGIGENYHALAWDGFEYDPRRGGYVVNAQTEHLLADASDAEIGLPLSHRFRDCGARSDFVPQPRRSRMS